jgi:hypothetical protein
VKSRGDVSRGDVSRGDREWREKRSWRNTKLRVCKGCWGESELRTVGLDPIVEGLVIGCGCAWKEVRSLYLKMETTVLCGLAVLTEEEGEAEGDTGWVAEALHLGEARGCKLTFFFELEQILDRVRAHWFEDGLALISLLAFRRASRGGRGRGSCSIGRRGLSRTLLRRSEEVVIQRDGMRCL